MSDFSLKGRVRCGQVKMEGETKQRKIDEVKHESIKQHCVHQALQKVKYHVT